MLVSKSSGRREPPLGFEEGESVDVMIGKRYGVRGIKTLEWRARCTSERMMLRWNG